MVVLRGGGPYAPGMSDIKTFPLAMRAPVTDTTPITLDMCARALDMARQSPRGRIIQPLHKVDEASLHRMLNAMQPGTYIRPHRHQHPPKAESLVVLSGALRLVTFDETGTPVLAVDARAGGEVFGVDVESGVMHTMIVLEPDTVMFEIKPGPYTRASDKDFAPWSPEEGTTEAAAYLSEWTRLTGGEE